MLTIEEVGQLIGAADKNATHYQLRKHGIEPDRREIRQGRTNNLYKKSTIDQYFKKATNWKRKNAKVVNNGTS